MKNLLRPLWYRLREHLPGRGIARRRFRRLNAGAGDGEIVLRPGLRLRVDERARPGFEHFAYRSPEMARELTALLEEAASSAVFFDVGACHGLFSLAFLERNPGGSVVAIEPSPPAREVLEENLRLNGHHGVVVVPEALGRERGTLQMRYEWVHLVADAGESPEGGRVEVPVLSLDDLAVQVSLLPDLVKIDVEGWEMEVLSGGRRVLAEARPVLLLESHPLALRKLGTSPQAIVEFLGEFGYVPVDRFGRQLSASSQMRTARVSRTKWVPEERGR